MTPRETIRAALANANVKAFLRVLREGESLQTDDAYSLVNGGDHLPIPSPKHPYTGLKSPPGKAFGAFMFIATTYDALQAAYPLDIPDTSPASQDFAAVADIAGHAGVLDDVIAGRVLKAAGALKDEWVALRTLKTTFAVYAKWGGTLSADPTVPPVVAGPTSPSMPSAPPWAPKHNETLTDVPDSERAALIKEFEAAGATVTSTKQPDGNWTVVATFGGKP